MSFKEGPFVQAACICEMVIQDNTGVFSLVRIIDNVTRTVGGPHPPEDMPPFEYGAKLVLMLKSGTALGRHDLKIVPELPSSELQDPIALTVHFGGEEQGNNIVTDLRYRFTQEGLHWFNIYLDEERLTRIPFRVKYNRVTTGSVRTSQ